MSSKYIQSISEEKKKKINVNYFTEKYKNIVINFDQIFNDEKLAVYNTFKLAIGKKRVYAMFANTMVKDNNKILSLDPEIAQQVILSYFSIKKSIDNKDTN